METMMQMKFRLFGAHAGTTVELSGTYFQDGLATVADTPENLGHLERALTYYRAYSEGSAEYDAGVIEEQENGNRSKTDEDGGSGDSKRVLGEHDPSSKGPADVPPTQRDDPSTTETRDEGPSTHGSGHEDSGLAEQPPEGDQGNGAPHSVEDRPHPDPNALDIDWKLVKIVEALDPANKDHWTQAGLPAIAAIEQAYGSGEVTRSLVTKAKPDWCRELAEEAVKQVAADNYIDPEEEVPF